MRAIAPALLLLAASCGQGDRPPNQAADRPGPQRPAETPAPPPTIAIAATGPSGCAATWDGQAVTPAQITDRTAMLISRAVDAAGDDPDRIDPDSLPAPIVRAPAGLGFSCADTILSAIQQSRAFSVRLSVGGDQAPVIMDFPLERGAPPPPIPMVLGIGAGGQLTWNGNPIGAAELAAQLTRIGGGTASPDSPESEAPPGNMELRVQIGATFGQLYELLRTTRRYRLRPFVFLPSAGPGPSPAELSQLPAPARR